LSEEDIEALAERVYRVYRTLPEADGRRVDPELMAEKLLGLKVVYRRLSRDGSILGITAPESVGVPVLEGGRKTWFFLDGRTILLDSGLLSPWASAGRRRFTLMHEIGHRLLGAVSSRAEWQADRLAGALLMPRELVLRCLRACAWMPGPLPDRRLDPERCRTFDALAETMGVSRRALGIRLEQLGLTEDPGGWTLRLPLPVSPEAGELEE
jgi:hypothetical protein